MYKICKSWTGRYWGWSLLTVLGLEPSTAPAETGPQSEVIIVGTRAPGQPAPNPFELGRAAVSLPITSQAVESALLDTLGAQRVEDLVGLVPALQVDVSSAGLASAVKLRGFAVTRLHYNGLPDVQRMFTRDLATVERIEVLSGPAGLFYGFASPGGVLHYVGKRPLFQPAMGAQVQVDLQGRARAVVDLTGPLPVQLSGQLSGQALAYRLIAAAQDGDLPPAGLPQRSRTMLAALTWAYQADASLTLEAEHMVNSTPYQFGTVITGGGGPSPQVQYDKLYVLTGGAPALRTTQRFGLEWQQRLANGVALSAQYGHATVRRDESLVGFFALKSDSELSGYFTRYQDAYRQHGFGLRAEADVVLGPTQHHAAVGYQGYGQHFLLTGTQNIGGFVLNVANPDFSDVDTTTLALRARYSQEHQQQAAWWASDRLRVSEQVHLTAGVRRLAYRIDADRTGAGLLTATSRHGLAQHLGLTVAPGEHVVAHLAFSTGIEPNRGTTRSGDYLPPQQQRQWELGVRWSPADRVQASAAAYQLRLSQLPMTDPADRTSIVTSGERQVQGVQATASGSWPGWAVDGQLNLMQMRQIVKTAAALGDSFVGVAGRTAGLRFSHVGVETLPWPSKLTLGGHAVGPRYADAANITRLPGYGVLHASADWVLRTSLSARLGVRNLFDRRYVEAVTALDDVYQGPRRQIWLRLEALH